MNKAKQIKTKLAQVQEILTRQPETRDNDRELVATVWRTERPNICSFGSANMLLRAFINKELSNPDDITRARRKVQELHPELRATRHVSNERAAAEADVRENISKGLGGDLFDQLAEDLRPTFGDRESGATLRYRDDGGTD